MLGLGTDSILHNGIFLTIVGQSTFIASYCMLVFVARLQRFDTGLTEAALDLGASHVQAFRKVMLPFLMPAIASAAVLAFLASFENYNTTTFTFGKYPTLTIELAQKVRYGINPSISALAFIIVVLTVVAALANEVMQRRKQLALANGAPAAALGGGFSLPGFMKGNPAAIVLAIVSMILIATIWTSQVYSPDVCKQEVNDIKQIEIQNRIKALQQKKLERKQDDARKGPDIFGQDDSPVKSPAADAPATNNSPFPTAPPSAAPSNPASSNPFGNVFAPNNLNDTPN